MTEQSQWPASTQEKVDCEAFYRCRNCGDEFASTVRWAKYDDLVDDLWAAIKDERDRTRPQMPRMFILHGCKNGIGVADLIGYRVK